MQFLFFPNIRSVCFPDEKNNNASFLHREIRINYWLSVQNFHTDIP